MKIILRLLLNALAVFITAKLLNGVVIDSFLTALIVSVVLGLVNTFVKPILAIITLPINLLTLGLFTFVLNALMVLLVSNLVPGFHVDGFLWALGFSVVLSIISSVLTSFV